MKKSNTFLLITILVGLVFISFGCSEEKETPKKTAKEVQGVQIKTKEFQRVVGWLSKDSVLLQTKKSGVTYFEELNIYNEKKRPIFNTKESISEVQISPDYRNILLYSAESAEKATMRIIALNDGSTVASRATKPLTTTFYWNDESPEKIMFVTYSPEWNFQIENWDYTLDQLDKIDVASPFISWYGDNLVISNNKDKPDDELGTFVPYFDTNFDKNTFLTFVPYKSAKIGSGAKEYKLVKIDPTNKKESTILELMDNQPILSYETGDLVLYGYLFDKVIDTKTGKMYNLINTPTKSF
ncbi:TPA_asm: hypothetical protein GEO68_00775 [Listeria monocytogenes]|nr:hypothetical protein [Listeria monocytogenes]